MWLTAAAVPSNEVEDSNRTFADGMRGDGYPHDSCSDGASAAGGGLGGGRKGAGGFNP